MWRDNKIFVIFFFFHKITALIGHTVSLFYAFPAPTQGGSQALRESELQTQSSALRSPAGRYILEHWTSTEHKVSEQYDYSIHNKKFHLTEACFQANSFYLYSCLQAVGLKDTCLDCMERSHCKAESVMMCRRAWEDTESFPFPLTQHVYYLAWGKLQVPNEALNQPQSESFNSCNSKPKSKTLTWSIF